MKWVFPFLTLSVAALVLAVFSTPVHVRIQLALNRRQTFARVSFGIINGLIWFTVYRAHNTAESEERGQGELIIRSLEELIRHPENTYELLGRFMGRTDKSGPQQDVPEDTRGKPETPRDRFARPIIMQALKRGLTLLRFRVRLVFGAGDAATTGIAVGLIHTLLGTAMAVFATRLRFPNDLPEITVVPCYSQVCVDMELDSIVVSRPGHVVFPAVFGQN
jgi:hypothetical protein